MEGSVPKPSETDGSWPDDCPPSEEDADAKPEDTEESAAFGFMMSEAQTQNGTIITEIGLQTQKSGILLAFVSIVLLEYLSMPELSAVWVIGTGVTLASALIGTLTIIIGMRPNLGIEAGSMMRYYKSQMYGPLRYAIYNRRLRSLEDNQHIMDHLIWLLIAQLVLFVSGLLVLVWLEVHRCSLNP